VITKTGALACPLEELTAQPLEAHADRFDVPHANASILSPVILSAGEVGERIRGRPRRER
jgi:hypothetical protein